MSNIMTDAQLINADRLTNEAIVHAVYGKSVGALALLATADASKADVVSLLKLKRDMAHARHDSRMTGTIGMLVGMLHWQSL